MPPGSLRGLHLVVADIVAAHTQLAERGVTVSEVTAIDGDAARAARGGTALDNVGFVFFDDPDGDGWAVQQISARGWPSPAAATARRRSGHGRSPDANATVRMPGRASGCARLATLWSVHLDRDGYSVRDDVVDGGSGPGLLDEFTQPLRRGLAHYHEPNGDLLRTRAHEAGDLL